MLACAGHTDFTRERKVDENTLFDLASLTKPIATAPALLLLYQDGLIDLDQSVTEFFLTRNLPHLEKVTLRHLLTHTSGLPPWRALYSNERSREQVIDELFSIELDHEPGAVYAYSCLGYIMLGLVVEAVNKESLDSFIRRRLFEPMGMHNTMFTPNSKGKYVFAATDHSPMRMRKLVGEVHDDNAFALGGVAGNAGLFSSILDLAAFCRCITIREQSCKKMPLGDAVLKHMFQNALPENVGMQSIGWFVKGNEMLPAGHFVSKFTIGHSGFTGTAVLINPAYKLFVILLTNRVCNDDDGLEFRMLRRRIINAVVGAIV
jgi:CubicO group peptidase (beta-lactamase class C family)